MSALTFNEEQIISEDTSEHSGEDTSENVSEEDVSEEEDDEEGEGEEGEEGEEEGEEGEEKIHIKKTEIPSLFKEDEEEEENETDEDEDEDEDYLKKFDKDVRKKYLEDFHPEVIMNNYSEIQSLIQIVRNEDGIIIDDLHKTIPFLTKYEKTRILGQRAKQINSGCKPFIKISDDIMDGYIIAQKELEEKKIPFIIRRPLPNGGSEFWRLNDLQIIC
jgi:DNA-directed RNA polymerase I, II, and III subunit RPABC2